MIATLSRFIHPKVKNKLKHSWPFKYKYNKNINRCKTFGLPPEFDVNIYRKFYKDIACYDDASFLSHYEKQGKKEGRRAHCLESRIDFVNLIPENKSVLELGPFFRPLMSGENVFYFNILDKEALQLRAASLGFSHEAMNCPEIHFVSATGDLSSVKEQFDFVLSSHVIEHQPNIIQHLNNVENLLKPDGCYFLMAPDKRYTFDHFIPESNIAQVITAYLDNKKEHSLCSMLEQAGLTTHNESQQH